MPHLPTFPPGRQADHSECPPSSAAICFDKAKSIFGASLNARMNSFHWGASPPSGSDLSHQEDEEGSAAKRKRRKTSSKSVKPAEYSAFSADPGERNLVRRLVESDEGVREFYSPLQGLRVMGVQELLGHPGIFSSGDLVVCLLKEKNRTGTHSILLVPVSFGDVLVYDPSAIRGEWSFPLILGERTLGSSGDLVQAFEFYFPDNGFSDSNRPGAQQSGGVLERRAHRRRRVLHVLRLHGSPPSPESEEELWDFQTGPGHADEKGIREDHDIPVQAAPASP